MAESGKKKHSVGSDSNWLKWFLKPFKDLRFRYQLYVFFICLLISAFIWLSIKLSKEYTTAVKHPVEYVNLPQDKVLTNDLPREVYLKVNGRGTELLKARLKEPNDPLKISLEDVQLEKQGEYKFSAQVPAVWFLSQIARESKYYDKLVDITPDTLVFQFEELKYRKVPVDAHLDYQLDHQVWLRKPMSISPDSVVISGIARAVDTVNAVSSEKINLGTVRNKIQREIKLKEFSTRFLSLERDSVTIKLPAEEYTESQVTIPIQAETPQGVNLKTFPERVTITYRVALKDYERVDASGFRAGVSYQPGNGQFLPVEVDRKPGYVRITELEPKEVEYILLQ
ncbi:MAG: hypothetical protein K9J27_08025 [Bacteroidales bacterium]|nr:hypothetical protein [Bacteroidales bacterium]